MTSTGFLHSSAPAQSPAALLHLRAQKEATASTAAAPNAGELKSLLGCCGCAVAAALLCSEHVSSVVLGLHDMEDYQKTHPHGPFFLVRLQGTSGLGQAQFKGPATRH